MTRTRLGAGWDGYDSADSSPTRPSFWTVQSPLAMWNLTIRMLNFILLTPTALRIFIIQTIWWKKEDPWVPTSLLCCCYLTFLYCSHGFLPLWLDPWVPTSLLCCSSIFFQLVTETKLWEQWIQISIFSVYLALGACAIYTLLSLVWWFMQIVNRWHSTLVVY